jgi:hypothetical protein
MCGRVWSNNRNRFLVGGPDEDGYLQWVACAKGGRKTLKVHKQMALHYLPNPQNLPVVNHKDGNKQNNKVTNLEWCTISHNTKEAYRLGFLSQKGEKNNSSLYSDSLVKKIVEGYDGGNITAYARDLGIPYAAVYSFVKGIRGF